jgi:hypothetical protein
LISEKLDDVLALFAHELMLAYAIREKEREKERRERAADDVLSTIMGHGKATMRTRRTQLATLKGDAKEEAKDKMVASPRGDGVEVGWGSGSFSFSFLRCCFVLVFVVFFCRCFCWFCIPSLFFSRAGKSSSEKDHVTGQDATGDGIVLTEKDNIEKAVALIFECCIVVQVSVAGGGPL